MDTELFTRKTLRRWLNRDHIRLFSNVFSARSIALIFNSWIIPINRNLKWPKNRWINFFNEFEVPYQTRVIEGPLFEKKLLVITLSSLYYVLILLGFSIHHRIKRKSLKRLFSKIQDVLGDIDEMIDACIWYNIERDMAFFASDCIPLNGGEWKLQRFFLAEINNTLDRLIEQKFLIPRKTQSGFFWDIEEEAVKCELTKLLIKYLPPMV